MKKNWFISMLASYDYHGITSLLESMAPSFRYNITKPLLCLSLAYPGAIAGAQAFFPNAEWLLGISNGAFVCMILAFVVELFSGVVASRIRKEQFSSFKFSRFSFKVGIYMVLIALPFHWSQNFTAKHKDFMAATFDWLQNFLIVQIFLENVVSILENLSVISGKDKTAWINKIQDFITNSFTPNTDKQP